MFLISTKHSNNKKQCLLMVKKKNLSKEKAPHLGKKKNKTEKPEVHL